MSPLMRRLVDVLISVALTAAVVFVIVVTNAFLMMRGTSVQGFKLWYAFIGRPDILGTIILTALVTMVYLFWQQSRRPRG
jgi:ABC-type sulfate transport system permease subunit